MQRVEPLFDWIIIDSPPAVPVSDASLLAKACDGVLMVVRSNATPSDVARKARQEFPDQALVGVVLNGTSEDVGTVRALLLRVVPEDSDRDQVLGGVEVIRLFNVYYPVRTLVLLVVEALIVGLSFVLGTVVRAPGQTGCCGSITNCSLKAVTQDPAVTGIVLLLSHGFDLYDSIQPDAKWDQAFRLLLVLGLVALALARCDYVVPRFPAGADFLPATALGTGDPDRRAVRLAVRSIPGWCSSRIFASESMCWERESEPSGW